MNLFEKHRFRKFILSIGLLWVISIAGFDINLGYRNGVKDLESITNDLMEFVSKHKGRLPESQDEFTPYASSVKLLQFIRIQYGIRVDELNIEKGKLYDLNHMPILLVEGRNQDFWGSVLLSKVEKRCSRNLYEHMVTCSGKSKEAGIKSNERNK
jgi:hypothetical protein